MSKISKRSPIVEVFSAATLDKNKMTEVQKADYSDSVGLIKELASNPNPMNLYELNQIIAYTVDSIIDTRLGYIDMVAEVKRTAFDERPKFKTKTEGIKAFWQAISGTADKSKVGHKYSGLEISELSAMPFAEWAEIASGRYDFAELIRDVANEFEAKAAQKVQDTLFSAFNGMASPNYASGTGIVAGSFDPLLTAMQRFGRTAIIGDFEALQKLPALTAIGGTVSQNINDEFNKNGLIGVYKGSPVIKMDNPYAGFQGYDTVLNKGLIYILPILDDASKSLKVQFAGDTQPMQAQDLNDRSYTMRFDKHMGAGIVDAGRHTLAVYEDDSLSV
jgi:hypothetical protein